jgi:fermentation-respiration switch protein FrsA (DUF1100 family)
VVRARRERESNAGDITWQRGKPLAPVPPPSLTAETPLQCFDVRLSEAGIYTDGRAALDYALTLPGVESSRTFLWGTSLGGAVAVEVATQQAVAGVILESTFTSAKDVAHIHYPFLPVQYFLRTKLNSIGKIKSLHVPILIVHGSHDTIIPVGFGRQLFQAANEPKELYEIPGADHNDTFFVGGEEYFNRIDQFVDSALPASPALRN